MEFLLAGTFQQWTSSTRTAETGTKNEMIHPSTDKRYQCLVEIYQDVPPSQLGADPIGNKGGSISKQLDTVCTHLRQ